MSDEAGEKRKVFKRPWEAGANARSENLGEGWGETAGSGAAIGYRQNDCNCASGTCMEGRCCKVKKEQRWTDFAQPESERKRRKANAGSATDRPRP
jgi:hypothetical protein